MILEHIWINVFIVKGWFTQIKILSFTHTQVILRVSFVLLNTKEDILKMGVINGLCRWSLFFILWKSMVPVPVFSTT